ncbi:sigma-70 family RNA polymerase sigma factor [Euzebya sp.]|uniref:sigma-70 family RNA polymerase sigma factor n=1 Tax=Euzebya sp. TaxID=1971409 RepID=UPI0035178D7D
MTTTDVPTGADAGHALEDLLEAHRRELTGYCYRMLGSPAEAEDAVQETMLRAWQRIDAFEGRASLRTWLYRIAHNVCIDMHRSPQRRARPMDLGPSTPRAQAQLGEPRDEHAWVMPIADEAVVGGDGDPAAVAESRESIRLAFVAAVQHLPPKQRTALILCEVLKWKAAEAAALLETSTASINSALQRARATMASLQGEPLDPVDQPEHAAFVERWLDAWHRYDVDELVSMMRDDVVLSMPPFDLWLTGPDDVAGWFLNEGAGCRGGRLVPIALNGTAGFGNYKLVRPGLWEPFGIQVVEVSGGQVVGHHNFLYPDRFTDYGLPARLEG